ncbi:hypothetical protein N7466_004984 [Penicillium verhagenii]|uniref:uncharacterized protein n=1 Tax=Penicillium verhagenii TaxID=1562060 RepID=UPI0025453C87|nr:uncharacterized protein N7466_004984 [Penicillium verhagenii]KAJ5935437.1 hypothetical protein N7466_004984 [Penicillium verhagenii]
MIFSLIGTKQPPTSQNRYSDFMSLAQEINANSMFMDVHTSGLPQKPWQLPNSRCEFSDMTVSTKATRWRTPKQ